ncbi:hypothetical protein ACWF9G_02400 [Nocardia sp. NPDC055029]|uniref:hypothetical protein n=1 Tax=Nocardia sp. NPDC060259 TaxID=3347088 RepID=UPI003666D8EA
MAECNTGSRLPEHWSATVADGLLFTDSIAAHYRLDVERPNLIWLYEQTARVYSDTSQLQLSAKFERRGNISAPITEMTKRLRDVAGRIRRHGRMHGAPSLGAGL